MARDTTSSTGFVPLRITAQPLHEQVVQQMVKQIVNGALPPVAPLPTEPELAQQFGVSRTVIREAVRVLAAKGLIVVKHGSGMRVQAPDLWNYLDPLILFELARSGRGDELLNELLEARRVLEVEAAALAAQRRTPDDLMQLHATLTRLQETLSDPDAYTRFDTLFHEQLLAMARNRVLREALRPVAEAIRVGRFFTIRQPGSPQESMHGHRAIYAAIEQGDPAAARQSMQRHVQQFERNIYASLRPADPPTGSSETDQVAA